MMREHPENLYSVVWPRGKKVVKLRPLANRLDTLAGKTVGQLWDTIFRGDEIFPILEEGLRQRYPGVKFVNYEVFGSTHGAEEHQVLAELPGKLKQLGVDAAISGMAC
jgi:hypothetical protein